MRVALGGVRDEAEIRGHRRTYVGAQAGRIVRAMHEAGTMNPVFLLDEVDKVGSDWRGDPSSALLEVLDPAQNHTFRDHYLEVDLDLSDVLFIATANMLDTIPGPLLDRMEIVRLDGYTEDEKVAIARDHLLARQVAAQRAARRTRSRSPTTRCTASSPTTPVRPACASLERELGKLLRKVATQVAGGDADADRRRPVDDLRDLPRPAAVLLARSPSAPPCPAWPPASPSPGPAATCCSSRPPSMDGRGPGPHRHRPARRRHEGVGADRAVLRALARRHELGIDPAALDERRFHVHFPAGAVPKDGPSAGVTMTTALVSLLTGRPVRADVGMTGEVTLQGRVLPIGGVKQKVLAAHRAGLTEVILPARNEADLDDVPEAVREEMTFHLVDDVGEVLASPWRPRRSPTCAGEKRPRHTWLSLARTRFAGTWGDDRGGPRGSGRGGDGRGGRHRGGGGGTRCGGGGRGCPRGRHRARGSRRPGQRDHGPRRHRRSARGRRARRAQAAALPPCPHAHGRVLTSS